MELSRRHLLQVLAVLTATASVPMATRWLQQNRSPSPGASPPSDSGPFAYLNVDPAALQAFQDDYRRHTGRHLDSGRWPDQVQAQFLLSTDFFRFDADETRLISYVGYYDPAVTPCNNPLARFD
jgi:hypothetical protein